MMRHCEVVITGVGVVTPCGTGIDEFWHALLAGRSGIDQLSIAVGTDLPIKIGGEISGFNPCDFIAPKKRLKLMCREMQTGYAAASLAVNDAGLDKSCVEPERLAVVFGGEMYHDPAVNAKEAALACIVDGEMKPALWGAASTCKLHPLYMLRNIPNMCACHIAIGHDARGPCNTIVLDDVSSLLAVIEGTRLIQRGAADVVIAGGSGTRINTTRMLKYGFEGLSRQVADPQTASRPFDARRDGVVLGEGAGAIILENRRHARRRKAAVRARLIACHSGFQGSNRTNGRCVKGIYRSIVDVLEQGNMCAADIGHVNAHGSGGVDSDRIEAEAIKDCLGETPVTAPKSYFGSLGAGGGAVELAVSVMAVAEGVIPATLNYEHPDPYCPVNVICGEPMEARSGTAIVLNHTPQGQLASVLIACDDE
jgi:3-oxoacyl-[acyl-carrier-protein] synthase II